MQAKLPYIRVRAATHLPAARADAAVTAGAACVMRTELTREVCRVLADCMGLTQVWACVQPTFPSGGLISATYSETNKLPFQVSASGTGALC